MVEDAGGSDLGRYRLGRLLGRGGMGEVYLAHDLTLDRDVAIKFVGADKIGDEVAARRLLHEAHAAAVLDHPFICTVHETGRTPEGQTFIVMQYVEGQPLSTLLQAGPMPVRDALHLAANIAEALSAAHHRGIVHRDLKPSNVMVTPSGRPKLLDFGIAKQVVLPPSAVNAPTSSADFTTVGTIVGTPAYMSPEQIQQRPLDGRSDLFSLGVVLFESLTGLRAFEGPSTLETIANVLHLHPPAPSTLRRELTDRHDELCRRLMAKDASDRFQSAEEVVGAIKLLLPDTSRTVVSSGTIAPLPQRTGLHVSRRALIAAGAVAVVAIAGFTIWRRPTPLPTVPPDADIWYQRGLQAMRDGTYETARRSLEQAIVLFPEHVLAYTRLAEAYAELDDEQSAQEQLLKVSQRVRDESRLPEIERLRVQALRASVLRQVDRAVEFHRELVARDPHAESWLDLGRAQEAAGLRSDARASYAKSAQLDPQSAAAQMWLGWAEALAARSPQALAAFAEAERLYREASNIEGETEVLLRRELTQEDRGDLHAARADLERAMALARNSRSAFQQIRAQLALSRVTASQGQFGEAAMLASVGVKDALESGLDTVAADGLVDLAFTLQQQDRTPEAEEQIRRAIQLAENRGARRIAARARLQLASWQQGEGRASEALTLISSVLPFVRENNYRLLELDALQIAVRAHQALDQLERAQEEAEDVLQLATTVKDETSIALASTNLASVVTALGKYPEALTLRLQAEAIHRRQDDNASLPFDLANRADLLIRLGRPDEAESAMAEIDVGVAKGLEAYTARASRVVFLRGFAAATELRCDEARRHFRTVTWNPEAGDTMNVLAPAIDAFCAARRGVRISGRVDPGRAAPSVVLESAYWGALAALEAGRGQAALDAVVKGLTGLGERRFDELRWRLAAVGAVAAVKVGDGAKGRELAAEARRSLNAVRTEWKSDFEKYGNRADVVYLVRLARLS
jgi:tetratricopeptide (TPR) repeat protein